MDMKKCIEKTIEKHHMIQPKMHIVLGLSGGPDSVCLFDILCDLAKELQLTLLPVHVNHQLRPGAAEKDQSYVEELCSRRGWPCRTFVYPCNEIAKQENLSSEEAGRKVRYEAFRQVVEEIVVSGVAEEKIAIALAHNANDQAETILFRILRGTGTDGLAGISYCREEELMKLSGKKVKVIRPLLDVFRADIEAYCEKNQLKPQIDQTNQEPIYARNKIRLDLIPYLQEHYNENLLGTLNRLAKIAAEDKEFLWKEADKAYDTCVDEKGQLRIDPLKMLHPALRNRVYLKGLKQIGMEENFSEGQIEAIEEVRNSQNPSARCDLAGGYRCVKLYDRLLFTKDDRLIWYKKGARDVGTVKCIDENSPKNKFSWEYFFYHLSREEYERLNNQGMFSWSEERIFGIFSEEILSSGAKLEVRNWETGDWMRMQKQSKSQDDGKTWGRKKIQDFFTDVKLPKVYRNQVPLLALGKEILWILPFENFSTKTLQEKGRFSTYGRLSGSEQGIIILELKRKL